MKTIKGEITIFLSLILVILISVLFTVIEAARMNAVRFQAECAADIAMQSCLAEYNRELLKQYDLFFIDIGYGTEESGHILLEQHLQDYMQQNLEEGKSFLSLKIKDLLGVSADAAIIQKCSYGTDLYGNVLERKAVDYMLDKYGLLELSHIQQNAEIVRQKSLSDNSMERRRAENERAIKAVDTTVKDDEGKKKKIAINNPADAVNSRRGSQGILTLVTKGNLISDESVNLKEYISHKGYQEGEGFILGEKEVSLAEDIIFQKYLMEKCGFYTRKKGDSKLIYQMEYILAGKGSDKENLEAVVNRLLSLRETADFLYILTDSGKQAQAEALAMTLAAVILFPELAELIKWSILIAWSYAEAVSDVKILMSGGRVPLIKTSESWKTDLKNAINLNIGDNSNEKGLSYEEYLHLFLFPMNKKTRNFRFMDLAEMDIRKTNGNENFCIDNCVHAFIAELYANSEKGYSYMLTRSAGYQK